MLSLVYMIGLKRVLEEHVGLRLPVLHSQPALSHRWSAATTSFRPVLKPPKGKSPWTAVWSSSCSPIQPMTEDSGTCWLTSLVSSHPSQLPGRTGPVLFEVSVCQGKLSWTQLKLNTALAISTSRVRMFSTISEKGNEMLDLKSCLVLLRLQRNMASFQRSAFQSLTHLRPRVE